MSNNITLKDTKLLELSLNNNVASFISFDKKKEQGETLIRFSNLKDFCWDDETTRSLEKLLKHSKDNTVNVRSFAKDDMQKSTTFKMGLDNVADIIKQIEKNMVNDLYSIVNENIDVSDGGVSGVLIGDTIEFSPNDTPRCVEKEGVCSLPSNIGINLLHKIYGKDVLKLLDYPRNSRVEFSIHLREQGCEGTNLIIWELTENIDEEVLPEFHQHQIPNNFSDFLGEKLYGLLLAEIIANANVPSTIGINRFVKPIIFGKETNHRDWWIRTVPTRKSAGEFATTNKSIDLFDFIGNEHFNLNNTYNKSLMLSSVLYQQGAKPIYSGASIITNNAKTTIIEGVKGQGDNFMTSGKVEDLPEEILSIVKNTISGLRLNLHKILGDFSIEWVYDGEKVWIVQLNQISNFIDEVTIVKGNEDTEYIHFDEIDVNTLRTIIETEITNKENIGISVSNKIGITSHIGDILRHHNIPSKIIK